MFAAAFLLTFIVVCAVILAVALRIIIPMIRDAHAPLMSSPATFIGDRTAIIPGSTTMMPGANGVLIPMVNPSRQQFYAVFALPNNQQIAFAVVPEVALSIAPGANGTLLWKGRKYQGFQPLDLR